MMVPKQVRYLIGAVVLAAAVTGCVSVRTVDDDELPAAWKREISAASVRPPQGRFQAAGLLVSGSPKPVDARLEHVFFPGLIGRSGRPEMVEVAANTDGTFTARAWRAGAVVAEVTLPGQVDPATGWVEFKHIPVKSTQKFGRTVATQSARMGIGSDGAIYVRRSITEAGMVLLMPAFGRGTEWGRWEPVSP
ncbi:MAG: hypothetical protein ACKOTF_00040 [Opitutaceae bacterium]